MPWTTGEVDQHIKGLAAKQKRAWVGVANSALTRCLKDGGKQADCEGSAIKQANAISQKIGEAADLSTGALATILTEAGVPEALLIETATAIMEALAALDADLTEAATVHTAGQAHIRAAATVFRKHTNPQAQKLGRHLARINSVLTTRGYDGLVGVLPAEDEAPGSPEAQAEGDPPLAASDRGILAGLLLAEAASVLRQDDSYDARRQAISQALCADPKTAVNDDDADDAPETAPYPYVVDLFDDVVVYQYGDDLYRRTYTLGSDEDADDVTFGDPEPVERAYVPVGEAATPLDESTLSQAQRDALPASSYGDPKNRLFPIKDQDDVDSAARLIGKAQNPEAVKARILAIAKRLGLKPPAAWTDAAKESAPLAEDAVLIEAAELREFTPWEVTA